MPPENNNIPFNQPTQPLPPESPVYPDNFVPPAQQQTPPKNTKKLIIIIAALVLVLIVTAVGILILGASSKPKSSEKTNQTANDVRGNTRSLLAYIDGAEKITGADFEILAINQRDYPVAPFLEAKGKLIKNAETGELHAQISVDKAFAQQKLNELKSKIGSGDEEYQPEFNPNDTYELDMAGLLAKLSVLPSSEWLLGFIIDEKKLEEMACKQAKSAYDQLVDDELKALKPNYEKVDDKTTKWQVDFSSTSKRLSAEVDELFENCTGEKPQVSDDLLSSEEITFLTKKDESSIEFTLLSPSQTTDEDEELPLLIIVLTDIKTTASDASEKVKSSPSIFSFDNAPAFIVALDKCKDFPVIAGGGLFGVYDYEAPDSEFYSGPSLFDTGYFCTEQDAKEAGYEASR